jgi:hypothetical protein
MAHEYFRDAYRKKGGINISEEEKYWGCSPVVTEHMEARMKASR